MRENLNKTKGLIMTQRVAFALSPKIGKEAADERLHAITQHALQANVDFRTALLQDPTVSKLLSAQELDELLQPEGYVGLAREEVAAVIAHVEALRRSDPSVRAPRVQATGSTP